MNFVQPEFEQCFYNPTDDIYVSGNLAAGRPWEVDKMRDMRNAWILAARGRTLGDVMFLDVGANVGQYSMYAAANGVGTIVAFEPLAANVGLFSATVARNVGFRERIRLIAAGAGQRVEKIALHVDLKNRGGTSFSTVPFKGVVNRQLTDGTLVPLDSLVHQHVDVMKIDVEGYESCAMAGARRLFGDYGVTMVFLEHWCNLTPCANSSTAVFDDLYGLGYEI